MIHYMLFVNWYSSAPLPPDCEKKLKGSAAILSALPGVNVVLPILVLFRWWPNVIWQCNQEARMYHHRCKVFELGNPAKPLRNRPAEQYLTQGRQKWHHSRESTNIEPGTSCWYFSCSFVEPPRCCTTMKWTSWFFGGWSLAGRPKIHPSRIQEILKLRQLCNQVQPTPLTDCNCILTAYFDSRLSLGRCAFQALWQTQKWSCL